jgi:opacity protein-like surface antigen
MLYAAGVSISAMTFAGDMGTLPPSGSGIYFSGFGGANWVSTHKTSSVNVAGLANNLYVGNSSSQAGPIVGGDIGYHWKPANRWFWLNVGVESSFTQLTSPNGLVHPLFSANPNFDTLNFNYDARAVPLFGMLTLAGNFGHFAPYVIGGLGVSWNKAYNYNEVPTNPNLTALPMRTMFNSRTQVEFAWTVGAGIAYAVTQSTSIGLEYRYTNYGNLALNPAPQQATRQILNLGKMTANALLVRMTVALDNRR